MFANLLPGWVISLDDISDDYVRVSWNDAPEGSPPAPWVVQLRVPPPGGGSPEKWITLGNYSHGLNNVTIHDLQPETSYQVRVFFNGVESQTLSFNTRRTFVGGVSATIQNEDDLQVSWQAQADAVGYRLELRVGGLWEFHELAGNYLAYNGSNLQDQSSVLVSIYARLPGDDRTGWAIAETFTGLPSPAPFSVRPINDGPSMRLSWSRVDFVDDGYRIERSPWDNQHYGFLFQEPGHGVTTYDDLSADSGIKYFYRIRAEENASSVPPDVSAWVETSGWTTAPPAPAGLAASEVTDSSVVLIWSALQDIEQYALERSQSPFTFWEEIGTSPTNEFTDGLASDFPIAPGNTYRYRVRGQTLDQWVGDTGNSLPLDVTTPSANPGPLSATLNGGGTAVNLAWSDVFGETGYRLEKRSATLTGDFGSWALLSDRSADTASTSDVGLVSSMRYQYRIRSFNGAGNSSWAESAEVSTVGGVPINVVASPGSAPGANDCDDTIKLTWDAVQGASGYVVRRSHANMSEAVEFTITGGSITSYVDTGLAPYTVYLYRVKSTSSGPDSEYGIFRYEQTCAFLTASPSGLKVNLSWTEYDTPFSEYRVERRNVDSGESFAEIATVSGSSNTSYTDTTIQADSTYEYRIRGWHAGSGGTFSRYSIERSVSVGPPPVTGFQVTDCTTNSVSLAWDPAYSANQIKILRSPAGTGSFSIIATLSGNATTYTDSGLASEAVFDYWIFASSQNGENSGDIISNVHVKFPNSIVIQGPDSATIDWDPITTAGIYQYRLQKDGGSGWMPNGDFFSFVTEAFKSGLVCGDQFRVLAFDSSSNLLAISETVVFGQDPLPAPGPIDPAFPLITISTSPQSDTSVQVGWGEVAGNNGYRLERREGASGPWQLVTETATDVTTFLDPALTPDTTYFYRAAGRNVCGTPGTYAQSGSVKTFTVLVAWRVGYWGNNSFVRTGFGNYANTADWDHDGCLNAFEFFHGSDPTDPADCPKATITIISVPIGTFLEVSWPVRDDTDGITHSFQLAANLQSFQDSEEVPGAVSIGGPGTGTVGVRVSMDTPIDGISERKFVRLGLNNL